MPRKGRCVPQTALPTKSILIKFAYIWCMNLKESSTFMNANDYQDKTSPKTSTVLFLFVFFFDMYLLRTIYCLFRVSGICVLREENCFCFLRKNKDKYIRKTYNLVFLLVISVMQYCINEWPHEHVTFSPQQKTQTVFPTTAHKQWNQTIALTIWTPAAAWMYSLTPSSWSALTRIAHPQSNLSRHLVAAATAMRFCTFALDRKLLMIVLMLLWRLKLHFAAFINTIIIVGLWWDIS